VKTADKQRWSTETKRPRHRGPSFWRRWIRLLILVLLVVLALHGLGFGLGAFLSTGVLEKTGDERSEQQADGPTVEQQHHQQQQQAPEQKTSEEESEGAPTATSPQEDPTLYLTVPKLGIYKHTVRNDRSEDALSLGAIKLPKTSFPWQEGHHTYIACHRLGFPRTESFNQCLNLPSMQKGDEVTLEDAQGKLYRYRVTETLTVGPSETWVTEPIAGREVVSLQTCLEAVGDFYTLGPNWAARYIVRADRVA
jgi:sortase A